MDYALLSYIDRFGQEAVMGRSLTASEIRRMTMMENIIDSYREKKKARNPGEWIARNPDKDRIIRTACDAWNEIEKQKKKKKKNG